MKPLLSLCVPSNLPSITSTDVLLLMIRGDDSSAKYFARTASEKKDMLESWREGGDSLFLIAHGVPYNPEEGEMDYIIKGMKELGCEV